MKTKALLIQAGLACCAILFLVSAAAAKETYTGTMIGVGGEMGGVSRPFTLTIDSITSDLEMRRYMAILAEGRQDALLDAFRGKRLGYFSLGGQLGRDLNFVNETQTASGGRRITAVFERWMSLYELRSGARSQDYPFTYLELYMDTNGKGEGTLIPAARIYFDKKHSNQVDVENFGIYPARLVNVELRK